MKKSEMKTMDMVLESVCVMGVFVYILLQIFYMIRFGADIMTVVYRLITVLLIYAGLVIAQIYPEVINIGSNEKLTGKVRMYAVRMLRIMKLIIVYAFLIPSIGDLAELRIDAAYSLIAVGFLILDIVIYMYKIWDYNRSQTKKK